MRNKKRILLVACVILYSTTLLLALNPQGPLVVIVGTRPEAIKMMPVYKTLKQAHIQTVLCATGQHKDIIDDIFTIFNVTPDYNLGCFKPRQDLFDITQRVLAKTKELFTVIKPSLVLVQGDTTSAMAAALAAFYLHIPVGHVEAGLRTGIIDSPFPEEVNRSIISLFARYHFAPTKRAVKTLIEQSVDPKSIFCTGNTVIDALCYVQDQLAKGNIIPNKALEKLVATSHSRNNKIILLTAHRRESFGQGLISIFTGIKQALQACPDLHVIYSRHPNPAIQEAIKATDLDKLNNITIVEPLEYKDMVYLLSAADGVITDSGGLQEEALSLGKPLYILREQTERIEGLDTGLATLVGTNCSTIENALKQFMTSTKKKTQACTVYGDGTAAQQIVSILKKELYSKSSFL
jgi:UDP-N-acetylglucosamine 2-epimerase (non-hydrolysing)